MKFSAKAVSDLLDELKNNEIVEGFCTNYSMTSNGFLLPYWGVSRWEREDMAPWPGCEDPPPVHCQTANNGEDVC